MSWSIRASRLAARALDYLDTRHDLDAERLAFYGGVSAGAGAGIAISGRCSAAAHPHAERHQQQTLTQDGAEYRPARGAKRHAQADLLPTLRDRVAEHAVDAHSPECQSNGPEEHQQR